MRDYSEYERITRVEVILRDPSHQDKDGKEYVDPKWLEWSQVPWSADPEKCYDQTSDEPWASTDKHMTTMCPDCFQSWSDDHWIRVYEGDILKLDTQALAIELADREDRED